MMSFDVTLICSSYKEYDEIVELLDKSLDLYFPQKIKKILVTDGSPQTTTFDLIKTEKDLGWVENMRLALQRSSTEHVLIWIDDLILTKKVSIKKFEKFYNFYINKNCDMLTGHNIASDYFLRKKRAITSDYRVNGVDYPFPTMCSIVSKRNCFKLLDGIDNPWDFETRNDIRLNGMTSNFQVFELVNIAIKGKIALFRKNVIFKSLKTDKINFKIPYMNPLEYLNWFLRVSVRLFLGIFK